MIYKENINENIKGNIKTIYTIKDNIYDKRQHYKIEKPDWCFLFRKI